MATKKTTPVVEAPVEPETITVRFCVGVDRDGDFSIFGRTGYDTGDVESNVSDYLGSDVSYIWVDLELPKPKINVIKAKIVG